MTSHEEGLRAKGVSDGIPCRRSDRLAGNVGRAPRPSAPAVKGLRRRLPSMPCRMRRDLTSFSMKKMPPSDETCPARYARATGACEIPGEVPAPVTSLAAGAPAGMLNGPSKDANSCFPPRPVYLDNNPWVAQGPEQGRGARLSTGGSDHDSLWGGGEPPASIRRGAQPRRDHYWDVAGRFHLAGLKLMWLMPNM